MNSEDGTADVLGISAVIINDLKQRRQRDYDFDWDRALQTNGDTGIKLQYTHCRLGSLMEKQGEEIGGMSKEEIINFRDFPQISEDADAKYLIDILDQFEVTLESAAASLEACVLVTYLFGLCNASSKALKRVTVKNEKDAENRKEKLILFYKTQLVLRKGMEILGLTPLNRM